MSIGAGSGAGRGGVGHGPGEAALSIGAPNAPFESESFEAKRLTAAEYADLDRSVLVGVGATAPEASGVGGEATGDAGVSASVGATTWKRRLEPRHRKAVSSFFGGSQSGSGTPQTGSGTPRTGSGIPQTGSGTPQSGSGIPQPRSGAATSGATDSPKGSGSPRKR